ncbi:MAG: hypothetical protein JNJ85_08980 [Candidatus Kapabacteria bacterium]|nr:hypothetical protein [Candidatus Kapabacteria bacterium]
MTTAKEEVLKLLEMLPDTATLEDIQYHIYVREKIEQGLQDIQSDNTVTMTEFDKRMSKWIGK